MKYIAKIEMGLKDIINESMPKILKNAGKINFYKDLVEFEFGGEPSEVLKYPLLSSVFIVLYKFSETENSFYKMGEKIAGEYIDFRHAISAFKNPSTFRVRYSIDKGLASVDSFTSEICQKSILQFTSLKPNKLESDVEFYYIARHDGQNYFAVRLEKKAEETKQKAGELKPDIAYAAAYESDIQFDDVILDPFAKYGSIAFTINKYYKKVKVIAGDYENDFVIDMRTRAKHIMGRQPEVMKLNPASMPQIENESINKIITELPSEKHERIKYDLYKNFLSEAARVIKPNGSIYLLTVEPEMFLRELENNNTLVIKNKITISASKTYELYQIKKR